MRIEPRIDKHSIELAGIELLQKLPSHRRGLRERQPAIHQRNAGQAKHIKVILAVPTDTNGICIIGYDRHSVAPICQGAREIPGKVLDSTHVRRELSRKYSKVLCHAIPQPSILLRRQNQAAEASGCGDLWERESCASHHT